ncbi:MAG: fibronectin type III domain-containing protein [Ruminococcaceae bacterium]|nr:fibronectin type III domain-containing protein [Oscillospiraceae bacterium]
MKKIISLLLSIIIVISIPLSVSAKETTFLLNNSWYEGYVDDINITNWYCFTLEDDGVLSLALMHYSGVGFTVYNDDLSEVVISDWLQHGTADSPVTSKYEEIISKGTYYIKISSYVDTGIGVFRYSGKYRIKGTFKGYKTNDKEPNDFDCPMLIAPQKTIIGAVTAQDHIDWYKLVISKPKTIILTFNHYCNIFYCLYNQDLIEITDPENGQGWLQGGNEQSPTVEKYKYKLNKGTYYIKVADSFDSGIGIFRGNGKYQISWKYYVKKPSKLYVTSHKTTSLKLSWSKVGDVSGYQLQHKSGKGWKTIKRTTSNSYAVKNLKSGTKKEFRVRSFIEVDGNKYYSSWKTLTTATKPSTPSIKTPSTNKKHQIIVKWKKVSACSGYQVQYSNKKNFSSVIATKTVSGKDKTSYTGKNFTKGKTYYVRVRAYKTVNGTKYYGAWSSVKSIKCK